MASIRELKKEINNVLGGIIEAVYIVEATGEKSFSKKGNEIIDKAIATFDELVVKINDKEVENRSAHLTAVRKEFETKAHKLVEEVNALA